MGTYCCCALEDKDGNGIELKKAPENMLATNGNIMVSKRVSIVSQNVDHELEQQRAKVQAKRAALTPFEYSSDEL